MKKGISIILCLITITVMFVGCGEGLTEISREPIDVKYTEAYDSIETDYQYKYNVFRGEMQLVPVVKTVHHAAAWSIQYRITYGNGRQETVWCSCTEEEYNRTKQMVGDGDG